MKKILFSLMVLLIGLTSWSQESGSNIDLSISYEYSSLSDSTLNSKTIRTFNSSGQKIRSIEYNWYGLKWGENVKYEYSYNTNANETQIIKIRYFWNLEFLTWEEFDKMEYFYDTSEKEVLRFSYLWDANSSVWTGKSKHEYSYDFNDNMVLIMSYIWNSSIWGLSNKTELTYDINGDKILSNTYIWSGNSWSLFMKTLYSYVYDANGHSISQVTYMWNSSSSGWDALGKYEYFYDVDNKEVGRVYYSWNSSWQRKYEYEYLYDLNENIICTNKYSWVANEWDIYEKTFYYYNVYFSNEKFIICQNDSLLWQGKHYKEAGAFYAIYLSISNQDSIFELSLTTNPAYLFTESYSICDGDSLLWQGSYYETSGLYQANYTSIAGCDSIFEISLIVNPTYFFTESKTINNGESFDWHGQNLTLEGVYYHYELTTEGCVTYELNLTLAYYFTEIDTICEGESYDWHGQDLTLGGVYYDSLLTIQGCDSIYELTFVVNSNPLPFSITGQNTVAEYQIVIYSVPANPDVVYSWLAENGNVLTNPSDNSAEVQWGSMGTGWIYATSTNQVGCDSDTSKLQISIGNTVITDSYGNEIKIYPNPVKEVLYINSSEHFLIEIFDLSGRKILESENSETDVSILSSGTYIVKVKDREGVLLIMDKLVVE